jgi:hypothetical protein
MTQAMIAEVDEDLDNRLSYREYLLVYKKAHAGTLQCVGLVTLASSVNVHEVGTRGAKDFFDAKANQINEAG